MSKEESEVSATESRKIQALGRVSVPNEWWEELGLEEGDRVVLKQREEYLEVHSMKKVIDEV